MGDVMGHDSQIKSARIGDTDTFDYNSCFKYIKHDIESADIAIANLEVTLAGEPYKGYPSFSSPDTIADALVYAGVDAFVMANNHCIDRRKRGLDRTCDVLDKKGIPRTGAFKDSIDRVRNNPMIIDKKGFRLAVLNYTYGTNGIRVQHPNIINTLDTAVISNDIRLTKEKDVDEIIVCLHWGWEYQTKANPQQKDLATFLKSKGINIIIGSHPHVLQPMYLEQDDQRSSVFAYSMGNFISNQRTPPRDGAALIFIDLQKKGGDVKVIKAEYQLTWVYTPVKEGKKHFYVLPARRYAKDKWVDEIGRKRLNEYIGEAEAILKYNRGVHERNFNQALQPLMHRNLDSYQIPDFNKLIN